jgi:translation initiation factor 1
VQKNLFGFDDPLDKADQFEQFDFKIHLRVTMRNGRKSTTSVEGIPVKFGLEGLMKEFKKKFACNGHLPPTESATVTVIQLSGDKRAEVKKYLIEKKIANESQIIVHGF